MYSREDFGLIYFFEVKIVKHSLIRNEEDAV
jgi:hypothetical protein